METQTSAPVSNAQSTANQAPQQGNRNGAQAQPANPAPSGAAGSGDSIKGITQAAEGKPQGQASQSEALREFKINGKIVKMSQKEADDYVSMSYAANSKFDEASKLKKSVDKIISTAKTNPIQALMDPALGLTKDQIRDAFESWYHKEYIEAEQLSPDQRRAKELEAQLKTYQDAEAENVKRQRDNEEQELTNKQREYLQGQIIDAIERSGLPKSKWLAQRMAFYMRENLNKGWDAPLDLIVKQVRQERSSIMADLTENSDGDTLISLLGEGVVNKIRAHDLKRLREQRSAKSPEFTKSASSDGYGNNEKMSSSDVTKRLRDLRSGKKTF